MPNNDWKNRIVSSGSEDPQKLLANPRNWRLHPKHQQDALEAVLDEVGWVQNIIVNQKTDHVIDGHLRLSLAIKREEKSVPVLYVDLSEGEEALILATIDPLSALAAMDKDKLDELLREVETGSPELQKMLAELATDNGLTYGAETSEVVDSEPQVDRADELLEKWKVERGQIWELGKHRLMCGDCADEKIVARLMANVTCKLYLCDPPFQMAAELQAEILNRLKARQILWLSGTPSVYEVWRHCTRKDYRWTLFWEGGASMSVPNEHRPNISCDVFLAFGSDGLFRKQEAIKRMKLDSDCIPHCLRIGRDFTTWRLTPLMKPLLLFEGLVELLSEPGDVVTDLFLSSGTTLIACEKLQRRCYSMEIEPKYVAVCLQRFLDATGKEPSLIH